MSKLQDLDPEDIELIRKVITETLEIYGRQIEAKVRACEDRVLAAESVSAAAAAQMQAVLSVLTVLSHLVPKKEAGDALQQ